MSSCQLRYEGTGFLNSKFIPKQNILVYAYPRKLVHIANVREMVVDVQFPVLQRMTFATGSGTGNWIFALQTYSTGTRMGDAIITVWVTVLKFGLRVPI